MSSRRFILKSGLALAAWSAAPALLAESTRPRSVVWVGGKDQSPESVAAFKTRLAEAGWKEGSNLALALLTHAWGTQREMMEVFWDARDAKPDLLLGDSSDLPFLKKAFPQAALCAILDEPESLQLDPAHPRPDLTGISTTQVDLGAKRLRLAHEVLPEAKRMALVYVDAWEGSLSGALRAIDDAAARLGVQALRIKLRKEGQVSEMISALRQAKAQAVIPLGPLSFGGADIPQEVKALLDFQYQDKVPFVDNEVESIPGGFFIALAEPYVERYKRLADVVAKRLKDPAAAIPIDGSLRIRLWVNTATAKALDIRVPQAVLSRADRVVG